MKKVITFTILCSMLLGAGFLFNSGSKCKSWQITEETIIDEHLSPDTIGKWYSLGEVFETQAEAEAYYSSVRAEAEVREAKTKAEEAEIAAELGLSTSDSSDAVAENSNQNSKTSATSSTKTSSTKNTTSKVKEESPELPILEESEMGAYICLKECTIYDTYLDEKKELSNLKLGDEVKFTGMSSNGFYQVEFESTKGYVETNNSNFIDVTTYESGWSETNKKEPTCAEKGVIEYTNTYSGLTKSEELDTKSHTRGPLETIKKATLLESGEVAYKCSECGEILEQYDTPSLLKTNISVIVVSAIIALLLTLGIIIKTKKKTIA